MSYRLRGHHGLFDTQFARVGYWRVTQRERVPHHTVTHSRHLLYTFRTHVHPYVERLVSELVERDIDGLQEIDTLDLPNSGDPASPVLYDKFFATQYAPTTIVSPTRPEELGATKAGVTGDFPVDELDFDYAEGAYAVYNWELFYHVPFTIALHLSRNNRFAEAQRWFHYIFDPTDNSSGKEPQRFWKVRPFRVDEVEHVQETLLNLSTGANPTLRDQTVTAIGAWRDSPFRPHLVARSRPSAYMYATVMAYLDNLVAWGDSLFRQDTRESINEAMQLYVLAAKILGPRPQAIPKKGSIKPQTYAELKKNLDEFGNAARALEAEIGFDLLPPASESTPSPSEVAVESLGRSLYFCIPRNDKLIGYWDTVGDRLYKIRNSLNLQGVFRQLPLFAPPIDPAMLARAAAAGVDIGSIIAGIDAPLAPVRFQVLLQRALEMCQEVKSLGGQILSAIEKKDAEVLGVIRAQHETNLLTAADSVRFAQWKEATKAREGIAASIQNAFARYRYYERLLGRPDAEIKLPDWETIKPDELDKGSPPPPEVDLVSRDIDIDIERSPTSVAAGRLISSHENQELVKLAESQTALDVAAGLEGTASVINLIPDFEGALKFWGLGAGVTFGGKNVAQLLSTMASISRAFAARYSFEANQSAKIGTYARREQDWAFQSNAAVGELNQLFRQLRGAELREHIAEREYQNHQKQKRQAEDINDFLTNEQREESKKRKTTTEGYYAWMKREAQGLHSQCFQFAFDLAKKAERALQHELAKPNETFIKSTYLAGRDGLFAGEKLFLDLKRMEMAFAELNTREFEITKHVSLRDWFPLQLLALRKTGTCEIDLHEAMFDLDCPGHTYRRIKSVAISIPCVTGPYASVNCSLSLVRSHVRTKANALNGEWYPKNVAEIDDRFASYPASMTSVVTSAAQQDTGMFETNLRDDRPLPFEGAGAVGRWSITLLGAPRQFDYETIADVILTIRYTARAGGALPANTVESWLDQHSARLFSLRHDFPTEWAKFRRADLSGGGKAVLPFELTKSDFPYRLKGSTAKARQAHLFIVGSGSGAVELRRPPNTLVGAEEITEGKAVIASEFDVTGKFELRFDSNSFDDIWFVVDWSNTAG